MKKNLTVEDLKRIQLSLLRELDRYCKEHDLRYYLTYGTLIGAMRHKGYIPWDDDIDVIMPREDYDILLSGFNQNNRDPQVALMAHSLDKRYYLPLAKLVDIRTVLKENVDTDFEIGVYIDIFPLENLADDLDAARARMKKGFRFNQEWMLKTIKWSKKRPLAKNLALAAGKTALVGRSVSAILEDLESFCCETKAKAFTEYVGVMSGISKGDDSRIFKKEWFQESMPVEFEGEIYPAPIGADAFLRRIYGDYMQLPPENQRVSHHVFEAWIKE